MKWVNANRVLLTSAALVWASVAYGASQPPLRTKGGAVATDNEEASRQAARILRRGGNAVDAAVTAALTLGVVEPASSGIGGGGFAVVYIAGEKKTYVVDFRETAPAALTPEKFAPGGTLNPALARRGGLAVGVPGEVAGLEHIWKRHGSLEWRALVEPAARLASGGFRIPWFFAWTAGVVAERLGQSDSLASWLAPRGALIRHRQQVRRTDLGRTLAAIAREGASAFYRGPIADDLVATVRAAGGVMTAEDVAGYQVIEREPLVGTWRDLEIVTMPLPSSGGLLLLEMLGILDQGGFDLAAMGRNSAEGMHVLVEVLKHAFADRAHLFGDAAGAEKVAERFLEPARLAALAREISTRKVKPHRSYGDQKLSRSAPVDDGGTSHLCVIDEQGNAVALTTTVNGYYGAGLIADEGGYILNNEMDDFSLAAGQPNMYGLVQSDYNLVGPGKRPLSSMTPTLVFRDGEVVGCFGGSGGPRIISSTFQVILNVFVHGLDASAAVSTARVHHQWLPETLAYEPELGPALRKELAGKGHEIETMNDRAAVQAIVRTADGFLEAASDPRKAGVPAVTD